MVSLFENYSNRVVVYLPLSIMFLLNAHGILYDSMSSRSEFRFVGNTASISTLMEYKANNSLEAISLIYQDFLLDWIGMPNLLTKNF